MVSQAELILRVITLWFLVLSQFFRDGMGPFKGPFLQGSHKADKNLITDTAWGFDNWMYMCGPFMQANNGLFTAWVENFRWKPCPILVFY